MEKIDYRETVRQLKIWNKKDIFELTSLLEEREQLCNEIEIELSSIMDYSILPSADIPPDVNTGHVHCPVWAMDEKGYCLCGPTAGWVLHLEQVREVQRTTQ